MLPFALPCSESDSDRLLETNWERREGSCAKLRVHAAAVLGIPLHGIWIWIWICIDIYTYVLDGLTQAGTSERGTSRRVTEERKGTYHVMVRYDDE